MQAEGRQATGASADAGRNGVRNSTVHRPADLDASRGAERRATHGWRGGERLPAEIGSTAGKHGNELLRKGFTRKRSHVSLHVRVSAHRVLFEIEDECGGRPPGKTEALFRPFVQQRQDRSGLGLGLAICLKAAKANGGELRVRALPGKGCMFTLDMPRRPPPRLSVVGAPKRRAGGGDEKARGGARRRAPWASDRSVDAARVHVGSRGGWANAVVQRV